MIDIKGVLQRFDKLKDMRSNYEGLWQELADYLMPRKRGIGTQFSPGSKQTGKVFDSTGESANRNLSAAMHGSLTNPVVRWFLLRMREESLNNDREVAIWLEECANQMYLSFRQSNLNSELPEVYLDLGWCGTGALFVEEKETPSWYRGFRGFRFLAVPISEYWIGESAEGRVNTFFRLYEISAIEAARQFGLDKIGPAIEKKLYSEPDSMVQVLHGIFPRERRPGTGLLTKNMPFASVHIGWDDKNLLRESGYMTFPVMVPRWSKTSGEVYGRGPGHTALPDVKTLNKATSFELDAWAIAVRPPMKVRDDGVVGQVRWVPAGYTSVRDMDALEAMESKANFSVGQVKSEMLKMSIKEIFFNSQLQLPSNQPMTATEIERRYELMQRVLGPTLGRLEAELQQPLIERAFDMMLRRGALPPPPRKVLEAAAQNRGDIDIEMEGPLARAQKQTDVAAIQRTYELMLPISQVKPSVLDNLDEDEAAKIVARATGAPRSFIRDPAAVAQIREARAAAEAEEQQKQDMERMAMGASKVAPMLKAMVPSGVVPTEAAK